MTEQEKMLTGQPYHPADPELRRISSRAKNVARAYNELPAGDEDARAAVLRRLLGVCGENVRVNQPFFIDYGCHIELGDNCLVNLNCTFLDTGKIVIGKNVLVGPDVKIYTAVHPLYGPDRVVTDENGKTSIVTTTASVTIGDDTWIGGGAIVLPGVTIGRNVVIGAGSVVCADIPDDAIACGVPCTVKKWNRANDPEPGGDKENA